MRRLTFDYQDGHGLQAERFRRMTYLFKPHKMTALSGYAFSFLFLRMKSSRSSMGIARSHSSDQDMVLNRDLVRCLEEGLFFIFRRHSLWPFAPSFYAQLQSFCETPLCRTIRLVRRNALWRSSQWWDFRWRNGWAMCFSLGAPGCRLSVKTVRLETRHHIGTVQKEDVKIAPPKQGLENLRLIALL